MNKVFITPMFFLLINLAFGQHSFQADSSKTSFYTAYDALKNMLEGKDSLNFERAVFLTENAYYDNHYNFEDFQGSLNFHTSVINLFAAEAFQENLDKYATMKKYEQKMFKQNSINWSIYNYFTDTILLEHKNFIYYKEPFAYSKDDPYGSNQWKNTQVLNLLTDARGPGNCYSLAVLFKIFSDRLNSEARLVSTPHHIYIQNRNQRGDYKNIELATGTFPGEGSIQVLTYTTKTSIMNGMAQRPLNDKEAITLNLIYLAKGFQHKYNDNTNDFLIQCADLALKHDSLSMNALLLKAEVTEARLFQQFAQNNIKKIAQARQNPHTKNLLANYEKQLSALYKYGYRQIPKDIQHIILSAIQGNKDGYITTDKTPNPFSEFGGDTRYATLSWGLFDEMHYDEDTINYFHALLNTKSKRIISLLPYDPTQSKVDPVVFAMSVDPLVRQYPFNSPYAAFENNPVYFADKDGMDAIGQVQGNTITITTKIYITGANGTDQKAKDMQNQINQYYKKGGTFTDDKGNVYNVKFNINVEVFNPKTTTIGEGDNVAVINSQEGKDFRSHVVGYKLGIFAKNEDAKTTAHETGHFLGLADQYVDLVPNYDADNTAIYGPRNKHSEDYPGIAKDELMAGGNKLSQNDLNAVAKFILDTKDKNGKAVINSKTLAKSGNSNGLAGPSEEQVKQKTDDAAQRGYDLKDPE